MSTWIIDPDVIAAKVIDHTTHFRLAHPGGGPGASDDAWWSVLLEIEGISIEQFEKAAADFDDDLLIPVAYDAADRERVMLRQPLVVFARRPLIAAMNQLANPFQVVSVQLGAVTPKRFLNFAATAPDMTRITVAEDATVLAVIDDGIAIGHDLFRDAPLSSRIFHATLLEALPDKGNPCCSVGRALDRDGIDTLLEQCSFNGLLDEDQFYAQTGQVDLAGGIFSPVALRKSHGTHIAALAAGHPTGSQCGNRPVICAMLPSRLTEDTSGLELLPSLYLAFHILVKQARRFCTPKGDLAPVVFNFSFGNNGGPHDGTGVFAALFEHYFGSGRKLTDPLQKAWLTLPAGNANLARLHAVDEGTDDLTLDLNILPDDRTPSQVQIWLPHCRKLAQPDFATITVTAPLHDCVGAIRTQPGQHRALVNQAGIEVARLAYQYVAGSTKRGLVTLTTNPTARQGDASDLAPAGIWRIRITRNDGAPVKPLHVWVRRDETLPGSQSGGRQAYFANPGYRRFDRYGAPLPVDPSGDDNPIRRSGTLSGFSCGPSPIVVAAYTEGDALLSPYSAAGPLNPDAAHEPGRNGPDVAAKGDDSTVLQGVLSAGSRSGSWVRMSGTSVASPQVARLASDHIRDHPGDGRHWSKRAARSQPFHLKGDPEEARAGAGGIDIPLPWNN